MQKKVSAQLTLGVSLKDEATFDNFYLGDNAEIVSALKKTASLFINQPRPGRSIITGRTGLYTGPRAYLPVKTALPYPQGPIGKHFYSVYQCAITMPGAFFP